MMEKMKIMVVDDNTVNLATVEQDLKDKYEVIPMISGRRAVKYLYRDKVDLILLDVQMPIMDGIETLREIRTQPNGITVPVIFLTSKNDKTTVVEGSKLGIMDFIIKPFEAENLISRIERVFKRLGRLPMEEDELRARVLDICKDLEEEKTKSAAIKMDEVLGYQINPEISGRIRNARTKLDVGMPDSALSMMERVVRLLEKNIGAGGKGSAIPISLGEINARLLYILDDLTNFKLKESAGKVSDLQRYDLPDYVNESLTEIKIRLDDYDDEEAERMVKELLEKLKNANSLGLKREKKSEDSNYHFSRLT
ncbi:MAG: response regulator [Lachnospiraceae bacterium]|nr:response regulator [Lachnospiraceae bacterium]